MAKKKTTRRVESGRVYVTATFNNTLVTITDECVLVQTQDPMHMDLLLGQITGKRFVTQKIGPTSILIEQDKIGETIQLAEKLNLIVRLVR